MGISSLHGPQVIDQKSNRTTLPRSEDSFTREPSAAGSVNSGASLPIHSLRTLTSGMAAMSSTHCGVG